MFEGELQMQSGKNITDDMAIYELLKQCRPDLIERLEEIKMQDESDES